MQNYDPTAIIQILSLEIPPAGYDCDGNFDGLQVGDFYLGGWCFRFGMKALMVGYYSYKYWLCSLGMYGYGLR